ncbi:hypothetical protein Skr01_18890 [Sphaerisporangium krabiense]|nr:hypothetical protein Skr01_18890 [Sphaerisporangium krabiense]
MKREWYEGFREMCPGLRRGRGEARMGLAFGSGCVLQVLKRMWHAVL